MHLNDTHLLIYFFFAVISEFLKLGGCGRCFQRAMLSVPAGKTTSLPAVTRESGLDHVQWNAVIYLYFRQFAFDLNPTLNKPASFLALLYS